MSVVEVADPAWWDRLGALADLDEHTVATDRPLARIVRPGSEEALLEAWGQRVFIRYARLESAAKTPTDDLSPRLAALSVPARSLLHVIQRHAVHKEVVGLQTWDPERHWESVRELMVMGLLEAVPGDTPRQGRHRLTVELPPPPVVAYDFSEAVFDAPDDLSRARPGPASILQDAASLAAAVLHIEPRRVLSGDLSRADAKRLARWIGEPRLAVATHQLEADARWGLALRALEALGAVSMDPVDRILRIDLGLERTLAGSITEAVHRFACAVVDRDLHPVLPAIQAALHAAGADAIDEVVFLDELRLQHRDVLYPWWERGPARTYPVAAGEHPRLYDEEGWERVEAPAILRALKRLERIGLIRRAPGVFAATDDGRQWAVREDAARPPIWVGSDLEIIVPPHALTPGQRFAVERLGRCISRDVTDRIHLERESVERWLAWHDVDEALAILRARAPGVPLGVVETLRAWQKAIYQVVVTRGVLVEV